MNVPRPSLTYQDRLNRYEIAQETLGFMMAIQTDAIAAEQKKPSPNREAIASLEAAFNRFRDEQDSLRLNDDAAVQRVLREYRPIVKANFERARGTTS